MMNKEFPLEYTERKAVVFDVAFVKGRDIDVCDINLDKVAWECLLRSMQALLNQKNMALKDILKSIPGFQMNL